MTALAFDAALTLTVLAVAWKALARGPIVRAIVLYMVLGLLAALCWVRLGAVDVALAEAAIGAGVTGALLLDAVRGVSVTRRHGHGHAPGHGPGHGPGPRPGPERPTGARR